VFLFLSGRRDGAFRVIPVTSDSGLLVSRSLRLALRIDFLNKSEVQYLGILYLGHGSYEP